MKESILQIKTKDFALRIVKLYKYLKDEKKENVLSKQVLRSGTSIGANVAEAYFAQSKKDFVNKMAIALKEVAETDYWLELLKASKELTENQCNELIKENNELLKMLQATINTSKKDLK